MALYEENYIRLRTLLPSLERLPRQAVSHVPGCVDLHVEIRERARYTTTLNMTCRFTHDGCVRHEPDLLVRICHDARTAEVLELRGRRRGDGHTDARRTLARRWRCNRFLYKWLSYCLRRGHRFPPDQQPSTCSEEALPPA